MLNFPATQKVSGTVKVGNLRATQAVSGVVTANPGAPATAYTRQAQGSFATPTGHHLVIASLSTEVILTQGCPAMTTLEYTSGGVVGTVFLPETFAFTSGSKDYYASTENVTLYPDEGTQIVPSFESNSSGCDNTLVGEVNIAGYLD